MGHVANQHKCRYMLTVNRYTQASNVRSRKIPSESGQPGAVSLRTRSSPFPFRITLELSAARLRRENSSENTRRVPLPSFGFHSTS